MIALYFSVEKEYRKNDIWMMNDCTALMLRTLKDADGNYLWNHTDDTMLQREQSRLPLGIFPTIGS